MLIKLSPLYISKMVRFIVFVLGLSLCAVSSASAADPSGFQAGKIIDDDKFTNYNSMSVEQIQQFLVSKNSVCLKDFRSLSLVDDNGDGIVQDGTTEQYGPETMSAAELIAAAARIYHINPQVLLVTLQKEQGLITRTDCPSWRYNTALGYGCPDTAPCDESAYGFTRQIDYGAYHLRGFYDDTMSYVPYGVGSQWVAYNPDASCSGTNVYIQNRATASLYSYTPYQPNAGALAAGYGEAPCGAYGNRNFYLYFTDWFGPTTGPGYEFVIATNPPQTMLAGQTANVSVTIKNKSGSTWYGDGNTASIYHTRLMMKSYQNSAYADTTDPAWLGTANQIKMQQSVVADGENATFTFRLKAPLAGLTNYPISFYPVVDGGYTLKDIGMAWSVSTPTPSPSYQLVDSVLPTTAQQPGQAFETTLRLKNTGNTVWYGEGSSSNNPTRLVTISPNYRASAFYDSSDPRWLASNQVKLTEATVAPNEIGTYSFKWKAPIAPGNYSELFSLVIDGYAFVPGKITINTYVADYDYQVVSANASDTLIGGDTKLLTVKLKNNGASTWYSDGNSPTPLRLAIEGYANNPYASTKDPAWLGTKNQIRLKEASVGPGETGTFEALLVAPYKQSSFTYSLRPIRDGVEWLRQDPLLQKFTLSTPTPSFDYETVTGTVNPPQSMVAGSSTSVTLAIRNLSNTVWRNDDESVLSYGSIRVLTANPMYHSSPFSNGDMSWLGTSNQVRMTTPYVLPGQVGMFIFTWTAPQAPGTYTDRFTLVVDGYAVFGYKGMAFSTTVY